MDHVRISGTESSSVILRKTKYFKSWKVVTKKVPQQAKPNDPHLSMTGYPTMSRTKYL